MKENAQEKRNLEAAKHANRLWNERRIDEYLETLAPDHVFRSVALPEPIVGREAYRTFLNRAFQMMPDWQISEPDDRAFGVALIPPITAAGKFVTVPSLNSGTRLDGFLNLPPTDKPWSFFSCTVYEFREHDGKVQATWAYWNPINVLQDVGAFPATASPDAPPASREFTAHHHEALSDVLRDAARFPFRMWSKTLRVLLGTR